MLYIDLFDTTFLIIFLSLVCNLIRKSYIQHAIFKKNAILFFEKIHQNYKSRLERGGKGPNLDLYFYSSQKSNPSFIYK